LKIAHFHARAISSASTSLPSVHLIVARFASWHAAAGWPHSEAPLLWPTGVALALDDEGALQQRPFMPAKWRNSAGILGVKASRRRRRGDHVGSAIAKRAKPMYTIEVFLAESGNVHERLGASSHRKQTNSRMCSSQ